MSFFISVRNTGLLGQGRARGGNRGPRVFESDRWERACCYWLGTLGKSQESPRPRLLLCKLDGMGVLEVGGYAKYGVWCWEPTGGSCCHACHYSLPCALGVMGGAQGLDWVGGDGLAILKDQGLQPMFCLYTILLFWCC